MPYDNDYINNGCYGGVMLGIQNKLPLVLGGVHEGKNEICARVGYFKLGINLKTETPTAEQIRTAVNKVIEDTSYRKNVETLAREFAFFRPHELAARYAAELIQLGPVIRSYKNSTAASIASL
jgi:UDP:flavonoid glycosyltransferase YjiC (YdhE family)